MSRPCEATCARSCFYWDPFKRMCCMISCDGVMRMDPAEQWDRDRALKEMRGIPGRGPRMRKPKAYDKKETT